MRNFEINIPKNTNEPHSTDYIADCQQLYAVVSTDAKSTAKTVEADREPALTP